MVLRKFLTFHCHICLRKQHLSFKVDLGKTGTGYPLRKVKCCFLFVSWQLPFHCSRHIGHTQKKYLPNFPTPKNPGIENFKPTKSFHHPCHVKSGVPPPPPHGVLCSSLMVRYMNGFQAYALLFSHWSTQVMINDSKKQALKPHCNEEYHIIWSLQKGFLVLG